MKHQRNWKFLLAFAFSLSLVFSMTACGKDKDNSKGGSSVSSRNSEGSDDGNSPVAEENLLDNDDYDSTVEKEFPVRFSGEAPCNLAIILGNHANAYQMPYSYVAPLLEDVSTYGGNVIFVVSDGDPRNNIKMLSVNPPDTDWSDRRKKEYVQNNLNELGTYFKRRYAQTEGNATLDAIISADDNLQSTAGEKIMVVMDSGYSTSGRLEFGSLTNVDIISLVDNLDKQNKIPNLSEYKYVYWFGLNQVAPPQDKGTDTDNILVHDIWSSVLQRAGISDYYFNPKTIGSYLLEKEKELPSVPVIEVSEDLPIVETPPDVSLPDYNGKTFRFIDSGWNDNRADSEKNSDGIDFIDKHEAEDLAQSIADEFNKGQEQIVLIGCSAKVGGAESSIEAGEQRANLVKNLLVSYGIDESKIVCYGAGYSDERLYHNDINEDGSLNQTKAQLNRAVYVFSPEDEIAKSYPMDFGGGNAE